MPVESHLSGRGRIYVVQGLKDSPVKIGFCRDRVNLRLAEMQGANPYPLHVIASAHGSMVDERRIHATLDAERMIGEWFAWLPRTIAFVTHLSRHKDVSAALATISGEPQISGDWDLLLIVESRIADAFGLKGKARSAMAALRKAEDIVPAVERRSPTGRKHVRYYALSDIKQWLVASAIPHTLAPTAGQYLRRRDGFVMDFPELPPKRDGS